jgi:hypothetical protein
MVPPAPHRSVQSDGQSSMTPATAELSRSGTPTMFRCVQCAHSLLSTTVRRSRHIAAPIQLTMVTRSSSYGIKAFSRPPCPSQLLPMLVSCAVPLGTKFSLLSLGWMNLPYVSIFLFSTVVTDNEAKALDSDADDEATLSSTARKIRGFDEKVEIHPILVNAFPQLYFLARPTRRRASFSEYKRRSDLFSHKFNSPIVTVLQHTVHQLSPIVTNCHHK